MISVKNTRPEAANAVAPSISTRLQRSAGRHVMEWLTPDLSLHIWSTRIVPLEEHDHMPWINATGSPLFFFSCRGIKSSHSVLVFFSRIPLFCKGNHSLNTINSENTCPHKGILIYHNLATEWCIIGAKNQVRIFFNGTDSMFWTQHLAKLDTRILWLNLCFVSLLLWWSIMWKEKFSYTVIGSMFPKICFF